MIYRKLEEGATRAAPSIMKSCPWCSGSLLFTPRFPVTEFLPWESRLRHDDNLPEPLRTVPACVCETPHCRYREPA